jgi:ABC-type lipoprotein export system ATPase subunit
MLHRMPMLRLEHISKRYRRPGGERIALDDVSLELDRGMMVGIFGPSGSGKTTLLRIAAGLQQPDSGLVIYKGERLDQMSSAERIRFRRREIACAWTAGSSPAGLAVGDHVALPLLVDGCGAREAARRVCESLLACEAEHCLDMQLLELSDGERQRVAIARMLVTEPRLMLADGPASNLSPPEQEAIMALLASVAREARVAVLIADSSAEGLPYADPILYLRGGKLLGPEPEEGQAQVYRFPSPGSRRAAADA